MGPVFSLNVSHSYPVHVASRSFTSQPNTCTLYHFSHNLSWVSPHKFSPLKFHSHHGSMSFFFFWTPSQWDCWHVPCLSATPLSLLLRINISYVGLHRYSKHKFRSFSKFLSSSHSLSSIAQQILRSIVFNAMPWLVRPHLNKRNLWYAHH